MAKLDISPRPIKWHIWQSPEKRYPLCWDDCALEFDTLESAQEFLASAMKHYFDDTDNFYASAIIDKDILYYDGGYMNATYKRVDFNHEKGDIWLIDVE